MKYITLIIVVLTLFLPLYSNDLHVTVTDIKNCDGNVIISLYTEEEEYLYFDEASYSIVKRTDTQVVVTFSDISSGIYALSAIHDEDSNGKLKQWFWIGPPKEGVASSSTSTRIPTFETAKFTVESEISNITIEMQYLGNND